MAELETARQELNEKKSELNECEKKEKEMQSEMGKLQKRIYYLSGKCGKRDQNLAEYEGRNLEKIKSLQKEIEKLKNENPELENLMELTEDPQIKTFCDETRQYSKIVREVMSLISYNVALK